MTGKEVSGKSRLAGGDGRVLFIQDAGMERRRNSKNTLFNFMNINSDDSNISDVAEKPRVFLEEEIRIPSVLSGDLQRVQVEFSMIHI